MKFSKQKNIDDEIQKLSNISITTIKNKYWFF